MANIKGIAHIAIQAKQLEETIRFYETVLEFKIVHQWSLPQFHLKHAVMLKSSDGQTMIELFDGDADIAGQGRKREPDDEYVRNSILHLAVNVINVDAAYEKALLNGAVACIKPTWVELGSPDKSVYNALVYSPNGEVIEFISEEIF